MDRIYRFLSDTTHNKKKLRLISVLLLFGAVLATSVIWFSSTRDRLEGFDLLDPVESLASTLWLLLAFALYLDYKGRIHSVSHATLGRRQLLGKYSRHVAQMLELNGFQLSSVREWGYPAPVSIERLTVELEPSSYQIPWYIEQYAEDLIRRFSPAKTFNGTTLRLNGFGDDERIAFRFQYARYYDYLVTNGSHDSVLFNELTVRDILEPGPALSPLEASHCANHLGLSALIVSEDNFLLLQLRSQHVSSFAGMLSPSVSGAANADTFQNAQGSLTFAAWFEAELGEEVSSQLTLNDFSGVEALGVSRELIRLGKPEIFFVARARLSRSEIDARIAAEVRDVLGVGGAVFGRAVTSPAALSRNESEKFIWWPWPRGRSIAECLASCALAQPGDGTVLSMTIDGRVYRLSESLAVNLAFLAETPAAAAWKQKAPTLR